MFLEEEKKGAKPSSLPEGGEEPSLALGEDDMPPELGKRISPEEDNMPDYSHPSFSVKALEPLDIHANTIVLQKAQKISPKDVFIVHKPNDMNELDTKMQQLMLEMTKQMLVLKSLSKQSFHVYSLMISYVAKNRFELFKEIKSGLEGAKRVYAELTYVMQFDTNLRLGTEATIANIKQVSTQALDILAQVEDIQTEFMSYSKLLSINGIVTLRRLLLSYKQAKKKALDLQEGTEIANNYYKLSLYIEALYSMLHKTFEHSPFPNLDLGIWASGTYGSWKLHKDFNQTLGLLRRQAVIVRPYILKILGIGAENHFTLKFKQMVIEIRSRNKIITKKVYLLAEFSYLYEMLGLYYFYSDAFTNEMTSRESNYLKLQKNRRMNVHMTHLEETMLETISPSQMFLDLLFGMLLFMIWPKMVENTGPLPCFLNIEASEEYIKTWPKDSTTETRENIYNQAAIALSLSIKKDFARSASAEWLRVMAVDKQYLLTRFVDDFVATVTSFVSITNERKQEFEERLRNLRFESDPKIMINQILSFAEEFNWCVEEYKRLETQIATISASPMLKDSETGQVAAASELIMVQGVKVYLERRMKTLSNIEHEEGMAKPLTSLFGSARPFSDAIHEGRTLTETDNVKRRLEQLRGSSTHYSALAFTKKTCYILARSQRYLKMEERRLQSEKERVLGNQYDLNKLQVVKFSALDIQAIRQAIRMEMRPFFMQHDHNDNFEMLQEDINKTKAIIFPVGSGNYMFRGLAIRTLVMEPAIRSDFTKCLANILKTHINVYRNLSIPQEAQADVMQVTFVLYSYKNAKEHFGTKYTDGVPLTLSQAFKTTFTSKAEAVGLSLYDFNVNLMVDRMVAYCSLMREKQTVIGSDQVQFFVENNLFTEGTMESLRLHSVQFKPVKVTGLVDSSLWFISNFDSQKPKAENQAASASDFSTLLDKFKKRYEAIEDVEEARPHTFTVQTQGAYGQENVIVLEEELKMQVENEMDIRFRTISSVHRKLIPLLKVRDYTNLGICSYEAYMACVFPRPIKNNEDIRQWCLFILTQLEKEPDDVKQALASGKIKLLMDKLVPKYNKNVLCFNYYTKKFINYFQDREYTSRVILYFANHAYVSSIKRLWKYYFMQKPEKYPKSLVEAVGALSAYEIKQAEKKQDKGKYIMKPLKGKSKELVPTLHVHYAFDIETYKINDEGDQKPYLLVLTEVPKDIADKEAYKPKYWWGENCIEGFIYDFLLPLICDKEKNYTKGYYSYYHIWAYNGSGFDFHFICDKLQHFIPLNLKGNMTHLKSVVLSEKVQMNDLACWYAPLKIKTKEGKLLKGLAALAYECKSPFQKTSLEHSAVTLTRINGDKEFKNEAVEYCIQDTIVLGSLIRTLVINAAESFIYKERGVNFKGDNYPCSSASLATSIYRSCFQDGNIYGSTDELTLTREQKSYHGGIVIALKTFGKNINVMDINSSYPFIMIGSLPAVWIRHYNMKKKINKAFKAKIVATDLYEIKSFKFPKDTILPNLMVTSPNGILMPIEWSSDLDTCFVWGCEIIEALAQNAEIEVVGIDNYEARPLFKEYVEYFYLAKSEAKKNGNSCIALFNKNMLNSLQGKFGKKFEKDSSIGDIGMIAAEIYERGFDQIGEIKYVKAGTHQIIWKDAKPQLARIGSCVRLPSYIAAAARARIIHIGSTVMPDLLYIDTDSLMLQNGRELPKEYIHDFELGKLKKEQHFDYGFFFGAKNYLMFNEGKLNEAYIKAKGIKGVKPDEIKEYLNQMQVGENGSFVSLIEPFFIRKFGQVRVTSIQREVKPTFALKRKILSNGDSRAYTNITEAIDCAKIDQERFVSKKTSHIELPKVEKEIRSFAEAQIDEIFLNKSKLATERLNKLFEDSGIPAAKALAANIIELFDKRDECIEKYSELLELQFQRKMDLPELEKAILDFSIPYKCSAQINEIIKPFLK